MLAIPLYKQIGIHERFIRSKAGRLFSVCVEVVEIEGELCGRIVSVKPVNILSGNTVRSFQLIGETAKRAVSRTPVFYGGILSPFSNLEFFMSQMTRAPSRSL